MGVSAQDVGALARIGPEQVLAGLGLAGNGRVYDLGLEINEQMPQGARGVFVPFARAFSATPEGTGLDEPFSFAAEVIIGTQHTSTHIDAFVHIQSEGRIYGGARAADARGDQGWIQHGMETVPPIVGRAILLDVARLKALEALPDLYEITVDDLQAACLAASVEVRAGDVVLVRTGKIREFLSDPAAFEAAQPGVGPDAAIWLYEQGMAVLGTDTTGTEPLPFPDLARTTHRAMLVERGVHLLENVFLDELARDGVVEAAFVCLPLKLTGATGSWVRPIAIA
jgi:kynurenine formamidase